jgi:fatty acid desaturase
MTVDWYRSPIDREVLKDLTRRSDLRGLVQAGGFLLMFLATTAGSWLLFRAHAWGAMVAACYVHSVLFRFLSQAAAVHELSHGTSFRTKALNEFFYKLFCFLTWNNPVHFRASHMLHHQFTVIRGTDKEIVQGPVAEKLNLKNLLFWLTIDVPAFFRFFGTNLLHAAGDGDADVFHWDPLFPPDDPRRRQMIRWARLMLAGHAVLIALFIVLHQWVLIYLVSFGTFVGTFLSKSCVALQHTGLSENVPDWRVLCYTVRFNPALRFLYWSMNYHIEHHMYAAVPFYNLKKLHKVLADDYPAPQKSFVAGMRNLLAVKRIQRNDKSYVYAPVFPPTARPVKWK